MSALRHAGCGGEIHEDPSVTYPYEAADGRFELHPALRCAVCGHEIAGDADIDDPQGAAGPAWAPDHARCSDRCRPWDEGLFYEVDGALVAGRSGVSRDDLRCCGGCLDEGGPVVGRKTCPVDGVYSPVYADTPASELTCPLCGTTLRMERLSAAPRATRGS